MATEAFASVVLTLPTKKLLLTYNNIENTDHHQNHMVQMMTKSKHQKSTRQVMNPRSVKYQRQEHWQTDADDLFTEACHHNTSNLL
jgi:hypothetical protein